MTFHPPIPCSPQFIAQGQGPVQRHTDTRPEGTEKPNLHTSVRPYSLMNAQNGHLRVQRIQLKKILRCVCVWSGAGGPLPVSCLHQNAQVVICIFCSLYLFSSPQLLLPLPPYTCPPPLAAAKSFMLGAGYLGIVPLLFPVTNTLSSA